MVDHIIRATVQGGVRAFAAVTTNLVEESRQRHHCYPVASAALGRTMTAALLMAANLKTDESITVRIVGNGPIKEVIADANTNGDVRGYVKVPNIHLPLRNDKLDVGGAVGEGQIYVTRFTNLKHPFTGSAPLVSGEIAEDVTNYLYTSEQTPSSVALGVLVNPDMSVQAAGGFFIQALPEADAEILKKIESNLSVISPVSEMINNGLDAAGMLKTVFKDLPVTFYEQTPVQFQCQCTRSKVENMLITLGEQEIADMLTEGSAEVCCHFCGDKYTFDEHDLEKILSIIKK